MQKLAICRTESTGCGLWNTKSWRSTSLERLLILPCPRATRIFCKGEEKGSLMCLQRASSSSEALASHSSLSITLELVERGQPRNEPCPQAGVPGTLLTRGLISCCVLGERAEGFSRRNQAKKYLLRAHYLKGIERWGVENRNWVRKGEGGAFVFNPGCMLGPKEVFQNPNAQATAHTIYMRMSEGESLASAFLKHPQMISVGSKVREPLKYGIPRNYTQLLCFQWYEVGSRWVLGIGSF